MGRARSQAAERLRKQLRPTDRPGVTLLAYHGLYLRDEHGTWRYTDWGDPVPAARDVTLAERYAALTRQWVDGTDCLLVDPRWIPGQDKTGQSRPELAWVSEAPTMAMARGTTSLLAVPADEFAARADVVVTLAAPELAAENMLGTVEIAQLAGVDRVTVQRWGDRGQFPPAAVRVGGPKLPVPLWPRPIVEHELQGPRRRPR